MQWIVIVVAVIILLIILAAGNSLIKILSAMAKLCRVLLKGILYPFKPFRMTSEVDVRRRRRQANRRQISYLKYPFVPDIAYIWLPKILLIPNFALGLVFYIIYTPFYAIYCIIYAVARGVKMINRQIQTRKKRRDDKINGIIS